MNESPAIVEIRTMFGRRDVAEACADRLVAERLAACAQIDGPVQSTYRWQGAVERSEEFRCTCKTTIDRADACAASILRNHDYELPELIRVVVTVTSDYAEWVRASVESH